MFGKDIELLAAKRQPTTRPRLPVTGAPRASRILNWSALSPGANGAPSYQPVRKFYTASFF